MGGMGVGEDLSSVEVYSPWSGAWVSLDKEMREVNGWCSACLGESRVCCQIKDRNVCQIIRVSLTVQKNSQYYTSENEWTINLIY